MEGAETSEARADIVACLLEGDDKNHAFYYREYADEDGNVVKRVRVGYSTLRRSESGCRGFFKVILSSEVSLLTTPAPALLALRPRI
jgi:hypothetical protein